MYRFKFFHLTHVAFLLYFTLLYFGGKTALNGLAFLLLVSLIGLFVNGVKRFNQVNRLNIVLISFYLLHIFSAVLSQNTAAALFDLEVKFSFLIIPIIFGFQKNDPNTRFEHILKYFSIASLIAYTILLINALITKLTIGTFPTYSSFTPGLHASYLAAYATINLIVSAFYVEITKNKKIRLLTYSSLLLTIPIIWASQSKAGMLVYLIIASIIIIRKFLQINKTLALISLPLVILAAMIFISTNTRFKAMWRTVKNYEQYLQGSQENVESTAERIMTWDASFQIISSNWILGVGSGDTKVALLKKYDELGYVEPKRLQLNAHNQYFESTLYIGLPGFLSLLFLLVLPFLIKNEFKLIGILFSITYAIHFLFESMFNTQAGVVFFTLFLCIIINYQTTIFNKILHINDLEEQSE